MPRHVQLSERMASHAISISGNRQLPDENNPRCMGIIMLCFSFSHVFITASLILPWPEPEIQRLSILMRNQNYNSYARTISAYLSQPEASGALTNG